MKKILLLSFICLFAFSCKTTKNFTEEFTPRGIDVSFFDFREYSKQGFYIYPENCFVDYEPIGLIEINIFPSMRTIKEPSEKIFDHISNSYFETDEKVISIYSDEEISNEEILSIFVEESRTRGANGITFFRCSTSQISRDLYFYQLSGYLIKVIK